jgi:hypothetical protein
MAHSCIHGGAPRGGDESAADGLGGCGMLDTRLLHFCGHSAILEERIGAPNSGSYSVTISASRTALLWYSQRRQALLPLPIETMTTNTGTAFIGRVLEPDNSDLSPEAARSLPDLDFPRMDHKLMG